MPRPKVGDYYQYMTTTDVCNELGITEYQLNTRLEQNVFLPPIMVDRHGVRYFDAAWLSAARETLEGWKGKRLTQTPAERGGIRPMEHVGPVPSKPVEPPDEPVVVTPQPGVVPVICHRCGGQISWDTTRGVEGRCPYCQARLRLQT